MRFPVSITRFFLVSISLLSLSVVGNGMGDTTKYQYKVTGKVTQREEIWDRRSNPLMGRPDWLKEIILKIEIDSVLSTNKNHLKANITASAKEHDALLEFSGIMEGEIGIFSFEGNSEGYFLVSFDSIPGKTGTVKPEKTVVTTTTNTQTQKETITEQIDDSLKYFESQKGKDMVASNDLQKKAVRFIAKRYGLKNAEFVSLTSYSGPAPPDGGYIYWGVRGQKKGEWYIWQATSNSKLIEGKELNDPKRYQKCNSPETKISTPAGEIAIEDLKAGDTVYSSNQVPVRLLEVSKVSASKHRVCHIEFDNGTVIDISPNHPLADGRLFANLQAGDVVDGKKVVSNKIIPYPFDYTYDILPDSATGTYFVGGIEIGSTMK